MPERVVIPAARGQAACAAVLSVRLCRVERVEHSRRYFADTCVVDAEVSAEVDTAGIASPRLRLLNVSCLPTLRRACSLALPLNARAVVWMPCLEREDSYFLPNQLTYFVVAAVVVVNGV